MNSDERWDSFRYDYIETGWFDYDRHKTIAAMRKLSERIPDDVLENLPPLTVFAPSAALLGHVLPHGTGDSIFVYLSPRLERASQAEVDFTVAHEFAHIVLGHYKPGATDHPPDVVVQRHEDVPSEQDADRLAESWGFKSKVKRKTLRGRAVKSQ
ncbi:MAG: hypothetical protein WB952_08125 [Terriglobales bacterium]